MAKLLLSRRARDFLDSLPAKQFRQVALRVFDLLKDPVAPDTKQLTGYPYRRADCGEYRIVYALDSDTVTVLLVGKRNDSDVYKQLRRLA